MLQVIKGAAVSHGSDHSSKLKRSHRDAVAKRAHTAYTTQFRVELLVGINPKVLAFDVVSGQLAQPELSRIAVHSLKAELASQRFEVKVVRLGQRLRQRHVGVWTNLDRRVTADDTLAQRRKSHRQL